MKVRPTICDECPFRRNSMPGWLGSNTPEDFVQNALTDSSVACHMMVDQTLKRPAWEDAEASAPRCRGAVTHARNVCKMPRTPEAVAVYKSVPADREGVFASSKEFVEHHQNSRVRSWEF